MTTPLTHEEIVARQKERVPAERFPVSALLNDVRSLYNVGSMFRTADGANLECLYLSGITGTPPDPKIGKTALGADKKVPWKYVPSAQDFLAECRRSGTQVLLLEQAREGYHYRKAPVRFPCCLVVGNEVNGVDSVSAQMADLAIEIPMYGIKNSLNVSVAFGIAVYELVTRFVREVSNKGQVSNGREAKVPFEE